MARVFRVSKSRKVRRCHQGHDIPVGSAYSYAAPGFRGREIYACSTHPFRESQLTTGMASAPMAAREDLEETLGALNVNQEDGAETLTGLLDEIRSAWEDFSSAVREYADERESSLDAWENGNYQLEELRDTADAAADEAENFEVEDFSGDEEALNWEDPGEPDEEDEEAHDEWERLKEDHERALEELESHVQEQIDNALETASGLEF